MSRDITPPDLPDLTGRRAVLTGGSDGIGLRIARHLAGAGAELVLPVRNRDKGEAAVASIREVAPDAEVVLRDVDLSSLESIARLGTELLDEGRPIHLLVNNAGVMTPPDRQVTTDGFEVQTGTNHLAHVALVAHLMPLLRAGSARVTSQVSIAAQRGTVNWDDLNWESSYRGMDAYRQSKIAFGLFALELDRRSGAGGWGVSSNLSHPGVAPTSLLAARSELGRSRTPMSRRVIGWLSRRGVLLGTAESAAYPALLASTAPSAGGLMFGPSGPGHLGGPAAEQEPFAPFRDAGEATRVWDWSLGAVGLTLE